MSSFLFHSINTVNALGSVDDGIALTLLLQLRDNILRVEAQEFRCQLRAAGGHRSVRQENFLHAMLPMAHIDSRKLRLRCNVVKQQNLRAVHTTQLHTWVGSRNGLQACLALRKRASLRDACRNELALRRPRRQWKFLQDACQPAEHRMSAYRSHRGAPFLQVPVSLPSTWL